MRVVGATGSGVTSGSGGGGIPVNKSPCPASAWAARCSFTWVWKAWTSPSLKPGIVACLAVKYFLSLSWSAFNSVAARWASCLAALAAFFWSLVAAFSAAFVSLPSSSNNDSCLPVREFLASTAAFAASTCGLVSLSRSSSILRKASGLKPELTSVSIPGKVCWGLTSSSCFISDSIPSISLRRRVAASRSPRCSFISASLRLRSALTRKDSILPPAPPKALPATAPRTLASISLSNSLLPNTSGFSSINRSAVMLIASWAPSVKPSVPTPLNIPAVVLRKTPLSIPERSRSFSTTPIRVGPVNWRANVAGNIESRAADTEPKRSAVPGAKVPVSW